MANTPPLHDIRNSAADHVFHILELARQIVYELELKDLFRALPLTKGLWESREILPDGFWAERLRRLGYPDHVVQDTSQCLRTSYISIAQAVDGISRCVMPESNRIKMEPFPGFSYSSNCENSMVPPLISLSSNSLMGPREGNLYTLDGNVFKLLKTVVALPFIRVCEGHSVLTLGPDGSIIARKLKDWSLIARFERYIHLNGIMVERIWLVLEKYLVGVYNLPMEEQEDEGAEGDGQFKVEIWSYQQGLKCGQSILSGQFSGFHHLSRFYSNGECEYITMMPHYSPERVISWRLDTTSVTMFDHSLSPDQLWEGLHFQIGYGVVNVLDKDGKVSHYWAVDGRDVSKPVASMLAECASYQTLTFSDGCRVKLAKDSCVYDKTGRRIRGLLAQDSDRRRRRLNAVHLAGRPLPTKHDLLNSMYQCGGIIFDRFILTISFLPSSSFVEFSETLLILYSKEGDMLGEWMLEREEREITWFVDILGRLVVMYSKAGRLEEIEVLDFRGDLSESAKEAADFQELVTFSFSDETV